MSLGYCTMRYFNLRSNFKDISVGMTAEQVVSIMGRPSWDGKCGKELATGVRPGCARELGYAAPFAPLIPRFWLISIGENNLVIDTAKITSP